MKYLPYILFLFSCSISIASAQDEELKIATFIEPPFVDLVNDTFVGQNIEIAKLLSKSINLTPIFLRCPVARCLSMVKQGKADMIMGLKKLPEREKDLIFLNPPYLVQHYPLRFFTLASRKIVINNLNDLEGLSVGTLRGGSYYESFDNSKSIIKVELTSRDQLVHMLLRGRIDTFIEREQSILPLLPQEDYQLKFSLANYQYDKAVNSYIAISKHSSIKVHSKDLSQQLQKLVTNGTIKNIRTKSFN